MPKENRTTGFQLYIAPLHDTRTFDVTRSRLSKIGRIKVVVQGTAGNNFLGMASIRDRLVEGMPGAQGVQVDAALRTLCDRAGAASVLPLDDPAVSSQAEDSCELGGAGGPSLSLADIRQACGEELRAITALVAQAVQGTNGWAAVGPQYVVLAGGACRLPPVREAVVAALRGLAQQAWGTRLVLLSAEQATVQVAKGNAFIASVMRTSPLVPAEFKQVEFVDRTTNDLRLLVNVGNRDCLDVVMPSGTPVEEYYPSIDMLQRDPALVPYHNTMPITLSLLCMDPATGTCANRAAGRSCSTCSCDMEYMFYEENTASAEGKRPCGTLQLLASHEMLRAAFPFSTTPLKVPEGMLKLVFQAKMMVSGMASIRVFIVVGIDDDGRRILHLATTGTFSMASQSRWASDADGLIDLLRGSVRDACANLEYQAGLVRDFWGDAAAADRFEAVASGCAAAADEPDIEYGALQVQSGSRVTFFLLQNCCLILLLIESRPPLHAGRDGQARRPARGIPQADACPANQGADLWQRQRQRQRPAAAAAASCQCAVAALTLRGHRQRAGPPPAP